MILQWNEDLAVGHEMIDSQHRTLFEQFGAFVAACEERRGLEQLREVLGFLAGYIDWHFREEEELMARRGYPELSQHQALHRVFREKIERLTQELESAGPTLEVLIHTNKALVFWLTEHIRVVDTRLAAYLAAEEEEDS